MIVLVLALQAALSAPVVDHAPTVASEMRRGFDMAAACAGPIDWQPIKDCLRRVTLDNRAAHTNTDAFDLGVQVATWRSFSGLGHALSGKPSLQLDANVAVSEASLARSEAKYQARALHVEDGDIAKVLPIDADEWRVADDAPSPGR